MTRHLLAATAALALLAGCDVQSGDPAANAANASESAVETNAAEAPAATLGAPVEREAALKLMHDRHENMEAMGDAAKAVGRTLRSNSPDVAVIRASADRIAELAPQVPTWFPPGSGPDVGETHAKAEIWQKPEDFLAKAHALNQAAQAFEAAAQSGDMAAIRARFGELGKACKACHDPYREEHE